MRTPIEFKDIWEWLVLKANEDEKQNMFDHLEGSFGTIETNMYHFPVTLMTDEMKVELLQAAFNKYSLEELEKRLGTKFDLS